MDTKVVEWYYPALSSGVTHAVVNRSSAIGVVEQLNSDPTLVTALSHAAKHVHTELVATLTRERMGYAAVLDDAKQLLALAQRIGAATISCGSTSEATCIDASTEKMTSPSLQ